jgi:catechol 2,3-dioxygenase-like lactoylglutathione lyase family enzyme
MIDHTGVAVSDFAASKAFYAKALAPIGYGLLMEVPASLTGHDDAAGFGEPPKPDFWIGGGGQAPISRVHVAFRVKSRALVDAFYKAAIAAGGRDNGAPGLRPHYHPNYYGAFVLDPDGHNIEAVCHEAA